MDEVNHVRPCLFCVSSLDVLLPPVHLCLNVFCFLHVIYVHMNLLEKWIALPKRKRVKERYFYHDVSLYAY